MPGNFIDTNVLVYLASSDPAKADCDILWSEDMQHNMALAENLRIVNPFRTLG